ncbi:rod shape-determining protein MreC [Streptococcus sp. DD13]|uniref:rod shape-determining protein MreC n=1 Tax=Streptococcus sp. DD13 TaxID=1777881 RepID=UPI0007988B49|nr:rod shape-determining protein MreC [Streptococcus sp. DD13]KXT77268.1 hypothetical protein STRDD13_01644 [Streptococcus sp. DD13]
MKYNRFSRLIIIVSVFLVFSFSMLFLTVNKGFSIPVINNIVHQSISFISRPFSVSNRWISSNIQSVSDLTKAYRENISLKNSLSALENQEAELATLKSENENLKSNLEFKKGQPTVDFSAATVIDRTSNAWLDELTIDMGSQEDVKENGLVVANNGVIGYIDQVFSTSSTVRLFSNSNQTGFKLSVKLLSKDSTVVYGILSGYDSDLKAFIVSQLNSDSVQVGNQVVTSDLDSKITANLAVGQVMKVEKNANDMSSTVYVKPQADLSTIYSVLVVKK